MSPAQNCSQLAASQRKMERGRPLTKTRDPSITALRPILWYSGTSNSDPIACLVGYSSIPWFFELTESICQVGVADEVRRRVDIDVELERIDDQIYRWAGKSRIPQERVYRHDDKNPNLLGFGPLRQVRIPVQHQVAGFVWALAWRGSLGSSAGTGNKAWPYAVSSPSGSGISWESQLQEGLRCRLTDGAEVHRPGNVFFVGMARYAVSADSAFETISVSDPPVNQVLFGLC